MSENLDKLINEIDGCFHGDKVNYQQLEVVLKLYHGKDWFQHLKYLEYSFRSNIIHTGFKYDIILYSFLPRQDMKFKQIPDKGAIFRVMYGNLTWKETISISTFQSKHYSGVIKEGEVSQLPPGKHLLTNSEKRIPLALLFIFLK